MALFERPYDRAAAVEYANRWAYFRNPDYYDFSSIGGDCTSFASQCILAGGAPMNYTPTFGWYYRNINDRSPSWTGVKFLFNFLVNNRGIGPFGHEVDISEIEPGDICQLIIDAEDWQHTPVITAIDGDRPTFNTVKIAAHSYDCACRQLSSYDIAAARFVHIDGVRIEGPDFPLVSPERGISDLP